MHRQGFPGPQVPRASRQTGGENTRPQGKVYNAAGDAVAEASLITSPAPSSAVARPY